MLIDPMHSQHHLGYIGGSVLQRLLEHPKRDSFEITALVRSATKLNC
jgi:uncharacterized protein YbjT (DUF2867 family)